MKQLIRWKMGRRISLAMTAIVASGALAIGGPAGAEISGTVTSVKGNAVVGANSAEIASPVAEGDSIVTGPEAACSVLVDKRALIQFCGKAAVRLRHEEERNATIVDVTEGSARALVGPRRADEPLEIHTPTAIAAILGTILSVTVDPVTGDSTFALEEGKVQIETQPSDPTLGRSITLNAGEQVTVHADGSADEVQALKLRDIAKRTDCMDDRYFHSTSIEIARLDRENAVTDAITSADIPDPGGLPPVGAGPEPPLEPPGGSDQLFDPIPDDACGIGPFCTGDFDFPEPDPYDPPERTIPDDNPQRPGRCTSGIPGEHCF
jgi:hypothetical protein